MSETTPSAQTDPVEEARTGIRAATRLAWALWAACVALIALALVADFATPEYEGFFWPGERLSPLLAILTGVLSVAYPTVGAMIVSRLPANPIGWIFCGVGLLYTAQRFTTAYADYALLENFALPVGEYAAWFSTLMGPLTHLLAGVLLVLLFPDGRLPSRRWRIVVWAALFGAASGVLGDALTPGTLRTNFYVDNPLGVAGVIGGTFTTYDLLPRATLLGMALLLASSLCALLAPVSRLRRARGDERQQLKWFMYAAAPAVVCQNLLLVGTMAYVFATSIAYDRSYILEWNVFNGPRHVALFAFLLIPVFTYVAILRYHLYDIDLLINRTLVYGALSTCVVALYVLAVGGLGSLFRTGGGLGVSLLATGVIAVLFQPLRQRLQRAVNRLMYGERDDPYAAVSRLGRRLEATIAPEAVLPTLVETIAQALKLPYAAILLKEAGEGYKSAASYGSPVGEPESLPLVYGGEEIGRLVISPRAPGEGFSASDRGLLEDLARQAEVAVHAVRLTADLQRSRERLVATREEERRRLRRDLHDGLGPTLASLALKLDAARKMVRPKPEDAERLLSHLKGQTQETVAEVRRLVYGLRPPALDELGLLGALRQQAESHGFVVGGFPGATERVASAEDGSVALTMESPETLPTLPAAVEVACYRIVQEALTNVARHAHARSCRLRLSVEDSAEGEVLEVEVADDGVGMPSRSSAGVGMASMRERAEELGGTCEVRSVPAGGTSVAARLPLATPKRGLLADKREMQPWSAPSVSS